MESDPNFPNPPVSSNKVPMILGIMIFLIAMIGISYYIRKTNSPQMQTPSNIPIGSSENNNTTVKLGEFGTAVRPPLILSSEATSTTLPKEIIDLFPPMQELVVKSATFDKGKGLVADFEFSNQKGSKDILEDILSKAKSASMEILYSKYTGASVTAYLSSTTYQIGINTHFANPPAVTVHMTVLYK